MYLLKNYSYCYPIFGKLLQGEVQSETVCSLVGSQARFSGFES